MRVNITTTNEVNCYGKGQGTKDSSFGPKSEPIKKSEACLVRVSIDDG